MGILCCGLSGFESESEEDTGPDSEIIVNMPYLVDSDSSDCMSIFTDDRIDPEEVHPQIFTDSSDSDENMYSHFE